MTPEVAAWIERLRLVAHPEGGFYRETYRAPGRIPEGGAPGFPAGRAYATAIYYLLSAGEVSRLHRLRSDEVFHHYAGAALVLHVLHVDGRAEPLAIGGDPDRGQMPQAIVPAGAWFGATVEEGGSFALVGCTVAPGFDDADFELADRATLLARFPEHRSLIERLT
jgi:hypothetical protein